MEKEWEWPGEGLGGDFQERELGFWRTAKLRAVIHSGKTGQAGLLPPWALAREPQYSGAKLGFSTG